MRAKYVVIGVAIGVLLSSAVVVLAGNLNPPSGPTDAASQMYTLEAIYNRLDTGAAGTKMTSFTEPLAGPGSTMHTLDDIMDIAPAADDTNGAEPGDVLSLKTYWGLRTDGAWGSQTGNRAPAPVAKTGQTQSKGSGDDGDLRKGVAWPNPRFTDSDDGTVTDNLTGLIWLQDASCAVFFLGDSTGQNDRSWSNALIAANSLKAGYCGLTDGSSAGHWRLPNMRELQSLIDYGDYGPALPDGNPFSGVPFDGNYWSSTDFLNLANDRWYMGIGLGDVSHDSESATHLVWPVRGGQ
jgi:hypothetical protein